MTQNKISPDDPRLTAYALGELDAEERTAFENLLEQDPEAKVSVQQIQALAQQLETQFGAEAGVPTAAAPSNKSEIIQYPSEQKRRKVSRIYWWGGLAAAASVALLIGVDRYRTQEIEQREYGLKASTVASERRLKEIAQKFARSDALRREQVRDELSKSINSDTPGLEYKGSSVGTMAQQAPMAPTAVAVPLSPKERKVLFGLGGKPKDTVNTERVVANSPKQELDVSNEGYARLVESEYSSVAANPLSTFSIDVDTASYANVRRFLNSGTLPPREAVRVEELVNYFPYAYAAPKVTSDAPVSAALEVAACPWNTEHRLVRIGLKAKEIAEADRPAANLVLLLDTSGSMNMSNKLPLVQEAMHLVASHLRAQDHLAIVTYAGSSGLALPSTPGTQKSTIDEAIDALQPGGSTHGSMGIQLAYDIAKANFVKGGVNRVILCTDGDFNVGVTSQTELQSLIETKAKSGVFLTVLGFGMGNLKDSTLELLADKGNGNYGYVDSAAEARKLLVEQAGGTLVTVAKDVKVQVEFNPALVKSYRLVGYENRRLAAEDFNNDRVDAGEMGAGHTVTALYEVVPAGAKEESAAVDPLKYVGAPKPVASSEELLTVKVRYKPVEGDQSLKLEFPLRESGASFAAASADFKFAASVAAFGQLLSKSAHSGDATYLKVLGWAGDAGAERGTPLQREFLNLVSTARSLEEARDR